MKQLIFRSSCGKVRWSIENLTVDCREISVASPWTIEQGAQGLGFVGQGFSKTGNNESDIDHCLSESDKDLKRTYICLSAINKRLSKTYECSSMIDERLSVIDKCLSKTYECFGAINDCLSVIGKCLNRTHECLGNLNKCQNEN